MVKVRVCVLLAVFFLLVRSVSQILFSYLVYFNDRDIMLIFRFITLFWVTTRKRFMCFNAKKGCFTLFSTTTSGFRLLLFPLMSWVVTVGLMLIN